MVNIKLLKNSFGFGIQGFGLFWGLFERFLCDSLCKNGVCDEGSAFNCGSLFLFVGIIFIVCGASIILMRTSHKKKRRKRSSISVSELREILRKSRKPLAQEVKTKKVKQKSKNSKRKLKK